MDGADWRISAVKFEAHITYDRILRPKVEPIGESLGWKGSAIDPDPIMGDKPYAYLTAYDTDPKRLLTRMDDVVAAMAHLEPCVVALRLKIERIIYDTKTGVDELTHLVG